MHAFRQPQVVVELGLGLLKHDDRVRGRGRVMVRSNLRETCTVEAKMA